MPRHIAFLRAINVGGRVVKMDRLRAFFEEMGFTEVETFIASGNVLFTSPGRKAAVLEQRIEAALAQALGYPVATFLRTPAEVAAAAAFQPFSPKELEEHGHYVGFLPQAPEPAATQKLLACATAIDSFRVEGREVYWLCRKKISESKFTGGALEKALGMPTTLRNITTVRKLAAKDG